MKRSHHKPHRIKPKKSIFKKPAFWLVFLFLFLTTAGIYFLVYFEAFQVDKIIISGNQKVQAKELESLIAENIKHKLWFANTQNIFLTNSTKITKIVTGQYPVIGSIGIKKRLPSTLLVDIKERKPFAIFQNGSEYFFIDEKGVAFEKAPGSMIGFSIVRHIGASETEKLVLGEEVVDKETMGKIAEIQKSIGEKSQISVKEADIVSEERLNIKTDENWEAYFNLTIDIDLQIEKLRLILENELPKESREGLQYIDLRFKHKVYYK